MTETLEDSDVVGFRVSRALDPSTCVNRVGKLSLGRFDHIALQENGKHQIEIIAVDNEGAVSSPVTVTLTPINSND